MEDEKPEGYILDPEDGGGVYHCCDCAHTRFFLCVSSLVRAGRLVPSRAAGRTCPYCPITAALRAQLR